MRERENRVNAAINPIDIFEFSVRFFLFIDILLFIYQTGVSAKACLSLLQRYITLLKTLGIDVIL